MVSVCLFLRFPQPIDIISAGIGAGQWNNDDGTLTVATSHVAYGSDQIITDENKTNAEVQLRGTGAALDVDRKRYMLVEFVPITVTDVSLNKTEASIAVGGTRRLTATVSPDDATDKTVKWGVEGDAVKLYSDASCTTEIGADATDVLAVYAKGVSAGSANVTLTSNSDDTKTASCAVSVSESAGHVPYREASWDEAAKEVVYEGNAAPGCTVVDAGTKALEDGRWYVVADDVTVEDRITVGGTAHLILADGKTLTASKGITVTGNATLSVYAQSEGDGAGKLVATGPKGHAGIGGVDDNDACGTVVVHGGTLSATGGEDGAGIGGGRQQSGGSLGGAGGDVAVYGGKVTATGDGAAGIGGGHGADGGTLTVYGGSVFAQGDHSGIGGGIAPLGGTGGAGGTVTIHGGTVEATGNESGAPGIGGGSGGTGGTGGSGGTVTINGGTVTATGCKSTSTRYGGAGIGGGGGEAGGNGGKVTINGGTVRAAGGGGSAAAIGRGQNGSEDGTLVVAATHAAYGSADAITDGNKAGAEVKAQGTGEALDVERTPHMLVEEGTLPVTITLSATEASITEGDLHKLIAAVSPDDATNKTVVWTVDGEAVKLYSNKACTVEVGAEATNVLKVYAKGISAGKAVVTATSSADTTKTASCDITVNELVVQYPLWVGDTQVTSKNLSGTGWSYDAKTSTLTLNNYTYEGTGYSSWVEGGAAIYAEQSLTIVVKGENTVTHVPSGYGHSQGILINSIGGKLTIDGDGTLTANAGNVTGEYTYSTGIEASYCEIYIGAGATVRAHGGDASDTSRGIYNSNNPIAVDGTLEATGASGNESYGLEVDFGALSVGPAGSVTVRGRTSALGGSDEDAVYAYTVQEGREVTESANVDGTEATAVDIGTKTNLASKYVRIQGVPVKDVSLNNTEASLVLGDVQKLVATVSPENAAIRTVKWSVEGDAVKLYTDANCTTEVGADATDVLTVYAKGFSAGTANVIVTSCADAEKSASCAVTIREAAEPVAYRVASWDEAAKQVAYENKTATDYVVVDAGTTALEDGKWYVVADDVTVEGRITVSGTAHLILTDGKTLIAKQGITVIGEASLSVYDQSEGERAGRLLTAGPENCAGIGGVSGDARCGTVIVHGGTLSATGGTNGAGIGGGAGSVGGEVTVYGGTVVATGGSTGGGAASIGGGSGVAGGTLTVYGGTVAAAGGGAAAAISGTLAVATTHAVYGSAEAIDDSNKASAEVKAQGTGEALDVERKPHMLVEPGVLHKHSFTYAADGASITATCDAGCPDGFDSSPATLTISASNAVYDANAHGATLSDAAAWTEAGLTVPDIYYTGRESTGYDSTKTAPTNAGQYTASITVDTDKLAHVDYEIAKAAGNIGYDDATVSKTYGDAAFTNALTKTGDGRVSYASDKTSVATVNSETGEVTIVGTGDATITATVADGTNFAYATKTASYTITVGAKPMTVSAEGYVGIFDGNPHGITVKVTEPASGATIAYGITEGTYDLDAKPEITNVNDSKTVYFKVTAPNYADYTGSAAVTISKADQTAPAAPTSASVSINSITLTAFDNGEYSRDGKSWQESPTFTDLAMNTAYTFYQRLKEDDNRNASPASASATISTSNHVHEWNYQAEGATITATCSDGDGGHGDPKTATLTINAPELTTYGGSESAEAALAGLGAFNAATGLSLSAGSIQYYKATRDGDAYKRDGDALATAPTDAGDYLAEITIEGVKTNAGEGQGVAASVGYTIAPAAIRAVAVGGIDAPVAGEALDAEASTTTGHVSLRDSGAVAWEPAAEGGKAAHATAYTATVVAAADGNHAFAEDVTATVNGREATATRNGDGTLSVSLAFPRTALAPVDIAAADKEATYSADGVAVPVEGMFDVPAGAGAATFSVTNGTGEGTYDAQAGRLSVSRCGTFTVGVSTAATNTHAAGSASATLTVRRAASPASVAGGATVMRGGHDVDLAGNVALNGATGAVSYQIVGDALGCTLDGSTLTSGDEAGTVTVSVAVAEDANHEALAATPIVVTVTSKGAQAIEADGVSATYGEAGIRVSARVTDPAEGGGAISYAVKEGSEDYIGVDAKTGALTIKAVPADGRAHVTVTAAGTANYAQATKDVVVTIAKADPAVTAPTARELTYDGRAQALVTAGAAVGGELQYALGDAGEAPKGGWGAPVPKATDAGTYHVWYRVVGDKNHCDVAPKHVRATIAPRVATLAWSHVSFAFDGTAHKPSAKVSNLVAGDKCAVTVVGAKTNAGSYTATAKGLSNANYTLPAKATRAFAISKAKLTGIAKVADQAYTGSAVTPKPAVRAGKATLKAGADFAYSYEANTKAGTATVAAKGRGNYTGSVSTTFKVVRPSVQYYASVQTYGDEPKWFSSDGQTSGLVGKSKRLEAVRIRLHSAPVEGSIEYRAHVQTYGWEKAWSKDGAKCGTTGQSKRLEAIQIRLTGQMAKRYDVYYRVHAQTYGWMGWAKNGQKAGTEGQSKRLEAYQVVLVPKGGKAPGATCKGVKRDFDKPFVSA